MKKSFNINYHTAIAINCASRVFQVTDSNVIDRNNMFLWLSMKFLSFLIRVSQKTRNFDASTGNGSSVVVKIFECLNNRKKR